MKIHPCLMHVLKHASGYVAELYSALNAKRVVLLFLQKTILKIEEFIASKNCFYAMKSQFE